MSSDDATPDSATPQDSLGPGNGTASAVTPEDVLAGLTDLAWLTGRFLPPAADRSIGPTGRGATVATPDGLIRDYVSRAANLVSGYAGEQSAAFEYGQIGHDILFGPGGQAGKNTNASGADMWTWARETKSLTANDNKVSATANDIRQCSALVENLPATIDRGLLDLANVAHPDREKFLQKLEAAKAALAGDGPWPDGLNLEISNAGGFGTGVSPDLQNQFGKLYPNLKSADGQSVELGFRNFQPPATRQNGAQLSEEVKAQGATSPSPTFLATPESPLTEPALAIAPRSVLAAQSVLAAGPLLLDWAAGIFDFAARSAGMKTVEEKNLITIMQDPANAKQLGGSESKGALIMVTTRSFEVDGMVRSRTLSSLPFFAPSPQEAFQVRQATSFFESPPDRGEWDNDHYYWYSPNGELRPIDIGELNQSQ